MADLKIIEVEESFLFISVVFRWQFLQGAPLITKISSTMSKPRENYHTKLHLLATATLYTLAVCLRLTYFK